MTLMGSKVHRAGAITVEMIWLCSGIVSAQGPFHIKEVASREVGIHVGGVQTPEIKEIVSREVGIFIGAEPDPPYREIVSREVSLALADAAPPPAIVEIAVSNTPTRRLGDTRLVGLQPVGGAGCRPLRGLLLDLRLR